MSSHSTQHFLSTLSNLILSARKLIVFTGVLLLSSVATNAHAVPALQSFSPLEVDHMPAFMAGYRFTAIDNLTVDALGAYDHNGNGLTNSLRVGLWDLSQTLLADVTVSTTDPLTGLFRYSSLTTPINLTAGTDYVIASQVLTPDPYVYEASLIQTDSRITIISSFGGNTSTFAFPSDFQDIRLSERAYMAANFNIVPEPSTLALLGLGLAIVSLRIKKGGTPAL